MNTIQHYYDQTADAWAAKWYACDDMEPCLRAFMDRLPENPRILDLCCGAGYDSMRLHGMGADVVGVDFSAASIAIAREKNPSLTFYEDNMLNDYSYIGQVDGVICIAGLVHLREDQLTEAFSRMAQVLSPGGKLLLVVRDGHGMMEGPSHPISNGVTYDRPFYGHALETLQNQATAHFTFSEELLPSDDFWKNYVFQRTDTNA